MKVRAAYLERYLLDPASQTPCPPDWNHVFQRDAPLKVEVGFGSGEYLAWWAAQEPNTNFVGIEIPMTGIQRACHKLSSEGGEHVRLVRGDARYLLRELFPHSSIDAVLMQFPMPWPKEKHAKHRVSSPKFAETLRHVLKPGGTFELVTDQEGYALEAQGFLGSCPGLEVISFETNPDRPFRTKYEKKWLDEGRSIFRLRTQLVRGAVAPLLLETDSMLHAHITSDLTPDLVQSLVDTRFESTGRVAEIKECLTADAGWILKVVSADESFTQFFELRLVPRSKGGWLLKIEDQPRPYPTSAVRFLIQSLERVLNPGQPQSAT